MSKITTMGIPKPIKFLFWQIYKHLYKKSSFRKYLPLQSILIETTTFCNLKCKGCYRTIHDYSDKNKHMSFDRFKTYVDQLPFVQSLTLHGLGEPTLNPDIVRIVEYARKSNKFGYINFSTNALGNNPQIYELLFSNGLSNISISVDSLNQEEVIKLRPDTNVDLLKKNIKLLNDKFAKKISYSIVVSKTNLNTFLQTVENLVELGAKTITFQPFDDLNGGPDICLSFKEKEDFLKKFNKIKTTTKIKFYASEWFKPAEIQCPSLLAPIITVEGYLTPCCRVLDKDIFYFGNLNENSFKELFLSKKYDKIQNEIINGKYPSFCKGCMGNHIEKNSSKWGAE